MWERFAALLNAQLALYGRLLDASRAQGERLKAGYRQSGDLLVKEQEALLEQLAQTDAALTALKQDLPGTEQH